jgi:hypothetical protein
MKLMSWSYGNALSKKVINILNKSDVSIFDKLRRIIDELPASRTQRQKAG